MKRARAPNFTTAEIMHLLRLVEKYPIILNRQTDVATTKDKLTAWQNLAKEYNSQTNFSPRTSASLLSCYKNQKVKVKKMHSDEKMVIKAPLLLEAQATESSSSECQYTFEKLVREGKKEEALHKKEINRTGGGPPPQSPSPSRDLIIQKVKTLIGPALEEMYTVFDGDAEFMKEQQTLLPLNEQIEPIECSSLPLENGIAFVTVPDINESITDNKILNLLKKKVDPSLEPSVKGKKKVNVSQSFQELVSDKRELVKAQKTLTDYQIEQVKLSVDLAKEKLEFEKKKNEMELKFLKEKYELELEILRK